MNLKPKDLKLFNIYQVDHYGAGILCSVHKYRAGVIEYRFLSPDANDKILYIQAFIDSFIENEGVKLVDDIGTKRYFIIGLFEKEVHIPESTFLWKEER
jgi:hypothetical protein